MSNQKEIVLEYDDLTHLDPENCLDQIDELVRRHPNIKMSFFTVPMMRGVPLTHNLDWCSKIRKHIDNGNVCLAYHGLLHNPEEFKSIDKTECLLRLKFGRSIFETCKLPAAKVFRGPHWGMCTQAVEALEEEEFTHLYNHKDYLHLLSDRMKVVYYNWNLKDEAPEIDTLVTHGHTHNVCENGIEQTMDKVSAFIDANNPHFKFVDEY